MLLSVPAAAAMLQCHEETVRRAIRRGAVKAIKTKAGHRVDSETLGIPKEHLHAAEALYMELMTAAAERQVAAERLFK
jgi:hypothetical protein